MALDLTEEVVDKEVTIQTDLLDQTSLVAVKALPIINQVALAPIIQQIIITIYQDQFLVAKEAMEEEKEEMVLEVKEVMEEHLALEVKEVLEEELVLRVKEVMGVEAALEVKEDMEVEVGLGVMVV